MCVADSRFQHSINTPLLFGLKESVMDPVKVSMILE